MVRIRGGLPLNSDKMSESPYHKRTCSIIKEFAESQDKYRDVKQGKYEELHINIHGDKRKLEYEPDVHFFNKRTNILHVFEVLDSELEHKNEIIADVFLTILLEHKKKLFFIVPTEEDEEIVDDLTFVVQKKLHQEGFFKMELFSDYFIYYITKKESLNKNKVFGILSRLSKRDGW